MNTTPLIDLDQIMRSLDPVLHPGEFAYCTLDPEQGLSTLDAGVFAIIRETEAVTLIVERAFAERESLAIHGVFRRLSLGAHTSLHAVGLTARIAGALAARGISANVIAGYHHDHFMVPVADADTALSVLHDLVGATASRC